MARSEFNSDFSLKTHSFTYIFCTGVTWLNQDVEDMKVLSYKMLPSSCCKYSSVSRSLNANPLFEGEVQNEPVYRIMLHTRFPFRFFCTAAAGNPSILERYSSCQTQNGLCFQSLLWCLCGSGILLLRDKRMQFLLSHSKKPESDAKKILLCRDCLCGCMSRFPGEGCCIEVFEHRDYFGEALFCVWADSCGCCVLESRGRNIRMQGLYVENISLKTVFCTVIFLFIWEDLRILNFPRLNFFYLYGTTNNCPLPPCLFL